MTKITNTSRKIGKKLLQWDDDISQSWEDLTHDLQLVMAKKNNDIYWKAEVKNFGWRNLDGHKYFKAETGEKLLSEVLPDTDNHFNIHNCGRGIAIQNYHHDSPTGNEWYYIVPCSAKTYDQNWN